MRRFFTLLILSFSCILAKAQDEIVKNPAELSQMIYLGTTGKIKDVISQYPEHFEQVKKENDAWKAVDQKADPAMPGEKPTHALPKGRDPLIQDPLRTDDEMAILGTYEGLGFQGFLPPDPTGEVGQNYYIQMCNGSNQGASLLVMDKLGNTVFGPINTEPLFWESIGEEGQGDPVVVYDEHAKRWLLTEFAPQGDNKLLIAVSVSEDPLGAYHLYSFQTPRFPDYPKFAVWNNAYVVTTNEFGPDIAMYALERDQMLAGEDARILRFTFPKYQITFPGQFVWQFSTPADWDGPLGPRENQPAYIMRIHDDSWNGGNDELDIYELIINWTTPSTSFVSGPRKVGLSPFESDVCEDGLFFCVENPNGQEMGILQQTLMNKLQYRNFGTHESIVGNFTIDVSSENQAGIRWFELRKVGDESVWELYQEGTWSPDSLNRFMAATAMDGQGNIAMAYAFVGPQTNPGIAYTGRKADDPLGMMSFNEVQLVPSTRPNTNVRWGDYAQMSVDPRDDRNFWFTGHYIGNLTWNTKVINMVIDQDSLDLRPTALVSPQSKGLFTDEEQTIVSIQNVGIDTLREFSVKVEYDGLTTLDTFIVRRLRPGQALGVTFAQALDLSNLESQAVTVYTEAVGDLHTANDTIVYQIVKRVPDQIELNEISLDVAKNCEEDGEFVIGVRNQSFQDIISLDVIYQVNGGSAETFVWTGMIPALSSMDITVPVSGLVDGANELYVQLDRPNGEAAVVLDTEIDSTFLLDFNLASLKLELNLDSFPQETRYFLRDAEGNFVDRGGPFENVAGFDDVAFCLEDGCYRLIMFDQVSNGMCCEFGEGSYRLVGDDGTVYAAGDVFGQTDETEFCIPFQCLMNIDTIDVIDASTSNSADGSILLTDVNGVGDVRYSVDGTNFVDSAVITGLAGNVIYDVVAIDDNGCSDTISVRVGAPVSTRELSEIGELKILPNPTDGFFRIELRGVEGAFEMPFAIYDQQGREVKAGVMTKWDDYWTTSISLLDREKAVYHIKVETESGRLVEKIIIQ